MDKYGYIYCTTDLKNGMKYIGQKKSDVFIQTYFGSGTLIRRTLNKRPNDFRVDLIEWCYSQEELNDSEYDWTKAVGLYPESYNLCYGGGTSSGWIPSKETREKISRANKGRIINLGKIHSKETKEKIGNSQTGHKCSDETKEKMRLKRKQYWESKVAI